jgi:hypothetical protein
LKSEDGSISIRGLGETKIPTREIPGSLSASPRKLSLGLTSTHKSAAQGTKDFEAIRKLHSHNYEMIPR